MSPFKKLRKKVKQTISQWVYNLTDWRLNKSVAIADNTLVIVKNDFIGDYILFRNFLPYIKQSEKYKNYKIILIGNITWKNLAETLDAEYYDEMIWVSFDKLFKDLGYRSRTIKSILSRGFNTLFYPVYSGDPYTELFFISKIKAREKIKFSPSSLEALKGIEPFNVLIHTRHPDLFEIYRYKEMFEVFLETSIEKFQWRPLSSDSYTYQSVPEKRYVVFFPGSSAHLKRWHPSNFVQVANYLIKQYNYTVVLAGSKKDNRHADAILSGVEEQFQKQIIDLTGKTSLLDLANLIKQSELLLTNDSASIHMAAVLDKEAVCVFMGENYGRFAPYPKEVYNKGKFICPPDVNLLVKDKEETNTFLSLDYNPDINAITPQVVIGAVEELLREKQQVTVE
ncbi:MAG: heptosyltransferase family [Chitinophagaceae bacterium]|nr:heptosyltransferase family [Chitinophagaceae bacterium]